MPLPTHSTMSSGLPRTNASCERLTCESSWFNSAFASVLSSCVFKCRLLGFRNHPAYLTLERCLSACVGKPVADFWSDVGDFRSLEIGSNGVSRRQPRRDIEAKTPRNPGISSTLLSAGSRSALITGPSVSAGGLCPFSKAVWLQTCFRRAISVWHALYRAVEPASRFSKRPARVRISPRRASRKRCTEWNPSWGF